MKNKIRDYVKNHDYRICLNAGYIEQMKIIGEGGNALVYKGNFHSFPIAVKLLAETSEDKEKRFLAEYVNMQVCNSHPGIVRSFGYDRLKIEESLSIPCIIMKCYDMHLRKYKSLHQLLANDYIRLFWELSKNIKIIHTNQIIHRDIKPENILIDGESFVLSDFGIAHFDPEFYVLKGETKNGDRMGNIEFSAPEQINRPYSDATYASDIYSFGQIMQWYATGYVHKGTSRESITKYFTEKSKELEIIDRLVAKCLDNKPERRYQSIDELYEDHKKVEDEFREIDIFDDIGIIDDIIRSSYPEAYHNISYLTNSPDMKRFIDKFSERVGILDANPWFTTGREHNSFSRICWLENNNILLNDVELQLDGIWLLSTTSAYDDLIIFESSRPKPYKIDENEYQSVIIIDGEGAFPAYLAESGYIRINGEPQKVSDLIHEYRRIGDYKKNIFIGSFYNSFMHHSRDDVYYHLENRKLKYDEVKDLWSKYRSNPYSEIRMRL